MTQFIQDPATHLGPMILSTLITEVRHATQREHSRNQVWEGWAPVKVIGVKHMSLNLISVFSFFAEDLAKVDHSVAKIPAWSGLSNPYVFIYAIRVEYHFHFEALRFALECFQNSVCAFLAYSTAVLKLRSWSPQPEYSMAKILSSAFDYFLLNYYYCSLEFTEVWWLHGWEELVSRLPVA